MPSRVSTYSICHSTNASRTPIYLDFKTMPDEQNNKLFYGVELEVEYKKKLEYAGRSTRDQAQHALIPDVGKAEINEFFRIADECQAGLVNNSVFDGVLKWEGTVYCGWEMNSAPATLRYHREALWDRFFEAAEKYTVGKDNCGMHIHIARESLSPETQAKLMYFIHERRNNRFLSKIAGRKVSPWASWAKTKHVEAKEGVNVILEKARMDGRNALCISGHTNGATMECRMFASEVSKQWVLQGIEFLDALIKYCNVCSFNEKELSYLRFLSFFMREDMWKEYEYLGRNLKRLRYMRNPLIRFARKAA